MGEVDCRLDILVCLYFIKVYGILSKADRARGGYLYGKLKLGAH